MREIGEKALPFLDDGRIREDVPFENYVYYRQLSEKLTQWQLLVGFWSGVLLDSLGCVQE